MNCEQARYVEFETPEAARHAEKCAACQEWASDAAALRSLAGEAVPVSSGWRAGVLDQCAAAPIRRWRMAALLAAAACVLLVIWGSWRTPDRESASLPSHAAVDTRPRTESGPVRAAAPSVPVQARQQRPRATRRVPKIEPVVVRLETADPDVIIYWTFESGGLE